MSPDEAARYLRDRWHVLCDRVAGRSAVSWTISDLEAVNVLLRERESKLALVAAGARR